MLIQASTSRKVFLVAPKFHGYSQAIANSLRSRGHEVWLWHYDERLSVTARVTYKVTTELPEKLLNIDTFAKYSKSATNTGLAALRELRPDVVLGIKADVLMPTFWLQAKQSGAMTHLWLYDELRRMRHDPEVFEIVEILSSYSEVDTRFLQTSGLNASHVPNGFDASIRKATPHTSGHILFVGARYPNREHQLVDLRSQNIPVLAIGRDWSTHPVDRLRTWSWRRPDVANMRDMPRQEAYRYMAGAAANLNSHFDQDGFTMRTFEIPGVGGLQLIDRADIDTYFNPGSEVLVYSSSEELADYCHRAIREPGWAQEIGERSQRRTLAEHTLTHRVALVDAQWD